jgi:hypothetical protein
MRAALWQYAKMIFAIWLRAQPSDILATNWYSVDRVGIAARIRIQTAGAKQEVT